MVAAAEASARGGIPAVWQRVITFLLCLLPLAWLVLRALTDQLSANPIEDITDATGTWTLRLVLITLAMTPLRRLTGWKWPLRLRRMLGLFVFFYASLHLMTYLWFDQFFLWSEILADIVERPFITLGMTAYALLLPLALTSNQASQRWLRRGWKRLHRLVYPIALLGVIHYYWLVKADVREPLLYGAVWLVLMGLRLHLPASTSRMNRQDEKKSL
ncbi:protein-methionine-sulfoxide reductase heme-binding subunit MsrQ [Thiohalobacter thiocyanaticus]|uniref:Protein-methionine-sulfoxide reductase heme-binding subunit MsrQ n=1 Tax=Thiohalobacter thiocyanaticus TaxID=585455 RepID=A0A426QHA5_9GAMM|nr:protein-methionine-sulfoxide reductase heme-binding subunit MsrQ [Thiohalobacter thiocyanaticus]RRQ21137.1 sulfoxide reductase heme-binding subunit YedZ [Thiohalobacter thiocyanaticus]